MVFNSADEDNTVFIYDGYEKKSEKVYYEAEMMEEFDGQVNVIVYEMVNNNSILRKFALDYQTKILTLAYIEERGVADVYFKKINSSTDESVFKKYVHRMTHYALEDIFL